MNMTNTHLLFLVPAGLITLVLGIVARLLWRRARAAAVRSIVSGRPGASPWRALLVAGLVVAVQWAVAAHVTDARVLLAVLAVPALFAGASIARLTAGTTAVRSGQKGAQR